MVGEVYAGLSSFKVLFDIAKGLIDMGDATARKAAVIGLQEKILAAQEAQAFLVQKVGELEKEVTQFKNWDADKQRYELKDIGQGCVAYALKEGVQPPEQAHYLCANCYAKMKKGFLQKERRSVGRAEVYVCNECGSELYVFGTPHEEHFRGKRR